MGLTKDVCALVVQLTIKFRECGQTLEPQTNVYCCLRSCFPTPVQGCIQEECDNKDASLRFLFRGAGVAVGVTQKNPCILIFSLISFYCQQLENLV